MNNKHRFAVSIILTGVMAMSLVSFAPRVSAREEASERAELQVMISNLQKRLTELRQAWQKASNVERKETKAEVKEVRQEIKEARKELKVEADDDDEGKSSASPVALTGSILLEELPGNPRVSCSLPEMRYGSRQNSVYLLQIVLNKLGYYSQGLITGYFGRLTEGAVSRFEAAKGIAATGRVSGETRSQLNAAVASFYSECKEVPQPQVREWDGVLQSLSGVGTTRMWGSYSLKLDNGTNYPVKPVTDNAENDALKYAGNRVKVYGRLVYNNFEGGFYGIEATDVDSRQDRALTVTRPNASDVWQTGKTYVITWRLPEYRTGESVTIVVNPPVPACVYGNPACMIAVPVPYTITTNATNSGTYLWTIPSDLPDMYRGRQEVRVSINGTNISDVSEVFTITPSKLAITVTRPNASDVWQAGKVYVVTWQTPEYRTGETVTISINPPVPTCVDANPACLVPVQAPYIITSNAANSGTYLWTIPSKLQDTYRGRQEMRVTVNETGATDVSEVFTITPYLSQNISVSSPKTGDVWIAGSVYTIAYTAPAAVSRVNITLDSPVRCITTPCPSGLSIASNVPNTGSYFWTIPSSTMNSSGYQMRVSAVEGGYSDGVSGVFAIKSYGSNTSPIITSVSGPEKLSVREAGTWTVYAYDEQNDQLSYSVNWGDEPVVVMANVAELVPVLRGQKVTFSHSYAAAGIYTVVFSVKDVHGFATTESRRVSVGSVGVNSAPRIVGLPAIPVTVRVGERTSFSWTAEDADLDRLSWSVSFGDTSLSDGADTASCSTPNCTSYSTSHVWQRAGIYTVRAIVEDGRGGSDKHEFNINVQSSTTSRPPVVTQVSGPARLLVNQAGVWTISAYDQDGGYLAYSVTWGDEPSGTGAASMLRDRPSSQSTSFSHVYARSGEFTVRFLVSDSEGNSTESSMTVEVGN